MCVLFNLGLSKNKIVSYEGILTEGGLARSVPTLRKIDRLVDSTHRRIANAALLLPVGVLVTRLLQEQADHRVAVGWWAGASFLDNHVSG